VAAYRYAVLYTPPAGRPPPRGAAAPVAPTDPPASGAGSAPDRAEGPAAPAREHAGAPSLGKLIPCGGGQPIPLRQPRLLVGRHHRCDLVIRCPSVSGRHCQLEWAGGGWVVRDLGSRNGIRVDGRRCEEQRLAPGSILGVAGVRYQVVYTPPAAGPGPQEQKPLFAQSLLEKAGVTRGSGPSPGGQQAAGEEDGPPHQRDTLED